MSQESITTRESSRIKIVDVHGDLGGHIFAELRKKLSELVDQESYEIVVNLSQVQHINSLAIGVMVRIAKQLRPKNGDLKVYGLTDHVTKIFDLIGTSEVLEIYDSESAALEAF